MAEFVKFKNADGDTIYINPSLVKSVRKQEHTISDCATSLVAFNDGLHSVVGTPEEVVKQLEETLEGLFYKAAYESNFFNRITSG